MSDYRKVFTFSADAWSIHTQANRTIETTEQLSSSHEALAEIYGDSEDNLESWSCEIISVDQIHSALIAGDLVYSEGIGSDVVVYRDKQVITETETLQLNKETDSGETSVYHVSEAGGPDVHDCENGPWFFSPNDYSGGDVFSESYPTAARALEAAEQWETQAAIDEQIRLSEYGD